jgi:ribonuclease HI
VIYTDGACHGNNDVHTTTRPAGWGVVVIHVEETATDDLTGEVIAELWGPVVVDAKSAQWLGAEVGSNNTGELSAIAEALIWVIQNRTVLQGRAVHIRSDSKYALGIGGGQMKPTANLKLAQKVRRCMIEANEATGKQLRSSHVKGHSNHRWNDWADRLATRGAEGGFCAVGRWALRGAAVNGV